MYFYPWKARLGNAIDAFRRNISKHIYAKIQKTDRVK